jgi:multiple sugar transport system permease protein
MKIRKDKVAGFFGRWFLTILVSFIVLFPLYWIFISSITPKQMLFTSPIHYFPKAPTIENYVDLFVKLNIGAKTVNTLIITFCALILSTILCLAAAYAFARYKSPGLSVAFSLVLFSALLPGIVAARPLYDFLRVTKLIDTYQGLIILYTSGLIPFTMLILYNSISQIPIAIEEAAATDGANFFQKIYYIILPLMRPAVAIIAIINFITCLNDLFTPLFYSNRIEVLSLGITTIPRESSYQLPWDKISTMGWYMIFPVIIFVVIFEKHIMEGIMAGGVKQ